MKLGRNVLPSSYTKFVKKSFPCTCRGMVAEATRMKNFKNLDKGTKRDQSSEFLFITSLSGPVPNLFKLKPLGH